MLEEGDIGVCGVGIILATRTFSGANHNEFHDSGSQKSYFEYVKVDSNLNVINVLNLSRTSERQGQA